MDKFGTSQKDDLGAPRNRRAKDIVGPLRLRKKESRRGDNNDMFKFPYDVVFRDEPVIKQGYYPLG